MGKGWADIHMVKGVFVRFGFDLLELRKLSTVRQRQSNGNASWGVSYIQPLLARGIFAIS